MRQKFGVNTVGTHLLILLWAMGAIPGVAAQTQEVCYSTIGGFWRCTQRLSLGARVAICIGASLLISVLLTLCVCLNARNRRAREHAHRDAIASVYQVDASQLQGPPPTTYVTSFDHHSPAAYPLPRSASINPTHPTNPYSAANPHPNIKVFPPSSQSPIPDPPSAFPATPAGYPHTPDADPEALSARQEHAHGTPRSGRSPNVRFTPAQERYYDRFSTKRHSHLNSPQTAPVNPAFSSPGAYPFPGYSSKTQQPQTAYPSVFPRPLFTGQPVQKDREREVRNEVA